MFLKYIILCLIFNNIHFKKIKFYLRLLKGLN
jgi:hypothetical protein